MMSRRARLLLTLCALLLFAGFTALGSWQLRRLQWKTALIERVDARVHAAPIPAPAGPVSAAADEYRHVRLSGVLLHRLATPVKALTVLGPGFWVLTPLQLADGRVVLVNRGYVPALPLPSLPDETASVTGLLRISEPGGGFLRDNDPIHHLWYSRDVQAIAAARGLARVAPYFVDADADASAGGKAVPVGGLTVVSFHNNHLIYALTWYALAAMVAGAFLWIRRGQR